jgi:hypothetical protein
MYEEAVRQQLESALNFAEEEDGAGLGEGPAPRVSTLHDFGMMTSDEGLVLDYGDGGVFTLSIGCYRRPERPNPEDV